MTFRFAHRMLAKVKNTGGEYGIGFPGGEIDIPELTVILRALLDCGFLNKHNRGNLLLEMTPFPGETVDYTVNDGLERLRKAWEAL